MIGEDGRFVDGRSIKVESELEPAGRVNGSVINRRGELIERLLFALVALLRLCAEAGSGGSASQMEKWPTMGR